MNAGKLPPSPITALPFVGPRPPDRPGNSPRCFWIVQPTGDPWRDSALGGELALSFLRFEAAQDHNLHPYILPWIVGDMPREIGQLEVAFLTTVGIAAAAGVAAAERVQAYWASERAKQVAEEEAKAERRRARRKRSARAPGAPIGQAQQ